MQKIKMKMIAVAISAVVAASFATAQQSDVTRLNVNLKDADLVTATKMVTERTGLQFMFRSTKAFNKVTLQLKDQTADDVIRYICDAAGAFVTKDENGVYVISANKPSVEPILLENRPNKKTFKKIKLLHAGADEVFARVVLGQILDPMARQGLNLRALNMAKQMVSGTDFGSKSSATFDSLASYNRYQPTAAPVRSTSDNGSNIITPGDEAANQRGGGGFGAGGGLGGGGGQQGGLGGGGQGGGLGGGQQGGQGGGTQLTGGTGLVPSTIDHITFDPTDNSLVVQGSSEEDINTLQNIIAQFDVRPRQVQIKVEFITTIMNLDQSLGFNINYSRGTIIAGMAGQDFLRGSDPVFLTYATGDAVFRLRTRLAEGEGRVVTAPIIRTMNNTPASVFAFTQDFILTSTTVATGNGGVVTTVNPQPLILGTGLSVTPRINADNTITMGLTPSVQSVVGTRQVTTSNQSFELPISASQSVSVVVNVKDRETIVLGGLNTESSNSTTTRVPVLSDLPILGQFFRKVVKGKTGSELLIFVTPVIIEDDDTGINP
jgi:general secretion pathway protein D